MVERKRDCVLEIRGPIPAKPQTSWVIVHKSFNHFGVQFFYL